MEHLEPDPEEPENEEHVPHFESSDFEKSESSEDDDNELLDSVDNGNIKSNCERSSNCEDVPIINSPIQINTSASPAPSCSDAKVSFVGITYWRSIIILLSKTL